jgi:DivIVA domain-containing protein
MEITPQELRDVEIRDAMRGYNRDEVNDLLERAAATIEAVNMRADQMTERLSNAQAEAGRTRETEDVLHRTLLLAQRAADEAVAEATGKARQMLDDADIQARRLVADAEADARRKGEVERRRLEEEILDLASRRDALLADVEALTRFEAEYRERMVRALEADLFALRSRPTSAPGSRPEPSEVELPPEEEVAPAATPESAPPQMGAPDATPPAASAAEPTTADAGPETREVDVRTLFEQATPATLVDDEDEPPAPPSASAPPVAAAAPPTPAPAPAPPTPAPQTVDLLGNDGVDPDVLDDDAFFATLRDAVQEEAPLGPREEGDDITGDHRFFDQDADRGGFRDVFRRRR